LESRQDWERMEEPEEGKQLPKARKRKVIYAHMIFMFPHVYLQSECYTFGMEWRGKH